MAPLELKKGYDLVFLDLKMPDINGFEALNQIRKISKDVPVCLVTAFHKDFLEELYQARKLGLQFDLVRKPLGSIEIQNLVMSYLEKPTSFK